MEDRQKYTHLLYGSTESYDLKCRDGCDLDMDCIDCPCFENAVQQLGEYEATGLSPEEINDMRTDWVVLKQLAEERKWISVEDRLPEIKGNHHSSDDVMVYLEDGGIGFSCLVENIFGQTWFECEHSAFSEDDLPVVTHWRPLPAPPED